MTERTQIEKDLDIDLKNFDHSLRIDRELEVKFYQGQWEHMESIHYPDGQKNCKLDLEYFDNVKVPLTVNASIRWFSDLEMFLAGFNALQESGFYIQHINFWYLFGMRSDRCFHPGMPVYFRDVVAPIIKSLPCKHPQIFRPHGTIAMRYLPDACSGDHEAINKFFYEEDGVGHKAIIISGDRSAFLNQEFEDAVTFFEKQRKMSGMSVELAEAGMPYLEAALAKKPDAPLMIVDDLCDGGATFIKEGNYLKDKYPDRKLELFVAHGIFSNGFDDLLNIYDRIYTTNSYQDFKDKDIGELASRITVFNVI